MIISNTNNNLITALYCRLSQEDMRIGESLSIENQRKMLQEYADQNGFRNCKFYVDDGFSGTDNTRPAYVEMMNDVKNGLVGTVIVKDQSRLGRDHLETDRLLEIIFPSYDVRFIAITDGVDSINGLNDMSTMRNWFNDFYARDTSKKIRAVIKAKGERGERISTAIPYGYMKDPNDPKQIIPDPETAPIVKRIFDMSAKGIGITKICDILSEEKVLNPSVYLFKTTGCKSWKPNPNRPYQWIQSSVRRILSNQVYCGDTVNFKTYCKSNKLKKRLNNAPENILVFKDTHDAIIDRVTFDVVQKHFEGKKRPDSLGNVDKYAGYLFCGECKSRLYLRQGRTIAPETNNYSCSGHSKRTTDCTAHYIRAVVLDEIVLTALRRMTAYAREHSDEFVEKYRANGDDEAKRRLRESEQQKESYKARLTQLYSITKALYEDRAVGRITPELFEQLSADYEQEKSDIQAKLTVLENEIDATELREKCINEFVENAKKYVEMPELTPELLRIFIRRIEVYEKKEKYSRTCGNQIDISFKFEPELTTMIKGEKTRMKRIQIA